MPFVIGRGSSCAEHISQVLNIYHFSDCAGFILQDLEKTMNKIRDKTSLAPTCPVKKSHWETIRGIVTIGKGKK